MRKEEARKFILAERRTLDLTLASKLVINRVLQSEVLSNKMHIGIYYPLKREINILPLLDIYPEKHFYLPVTKDEIEYVPYHKNSVLCDGLFHVKEPIGNSVPLERLDVIFIPCLAISKTHRRLGYGKGYYDKSLRDFKGMKIGICPKEFCDMDLEMQDFDLIVDFIIKG